MDALSHCSYGSAVLDGRPVAVARLGDRVVDLGAAFAATEHAALFTAGTLDALLASGLPVWTAVHQTLLGLSAAPSLPLDGLVMQLPFAVADYVDFYASEQHATNVGLMFRPDGDALTPNWKHLPIGYHGRAGTVVVSGTAVTRPCGQRRLPDGEVVFGPSQRLDIEAEVAFVVGTPSALGSPVRAAEFREHVFGLCLLNDWSARDIQAWEYVPLGPFLGKSFATSISPWITPLSALDDAWVAPPVRDPQPLPYLDDSATPSGLDIDIEVRLNGELISRPPFASMYWTPAQLLAHMTVNGASLRTGDVYASGTVSGPERSQFGSLLELSWGGRDPITFADGTTRTFLEDGDEVTLRATAGGVTLGEVSGRISPPVQE